MQTEAQTKKIYNHLKTYGHITAADAWERYHIMRLAARIADLRAQGVDIITNMVYMNETAKNVHFAVYTLNEGADDDTDL